MKAKITVLVFSALLASQAIAGDWDFTGFVGVDSQAFWLDPRFEDQEDYKTNALTLICARLTGAMKPTIGT
jgi:hypothetical protein